jgi:hypothetical protein
MQLGFQVCDPLKLVAKGDAFLIEFLGVFGEFLGLCFHIGLKLLKLDDRIWASSSGTRR